MTSRAPFEPKRGSNTVATPAAASASISIDAVVKAVRLVNSGANICHVRIGSGAQTATTADMPIRAGSEIIVHKGDGDDTLAYISAAGTTLHIQVGEGGSLMAAKAPAKAHQKMSMRDVSVAQDKRWETQDALRTLQRAAEIQSNKSLMAAAKREAAQQAKALASVIKKR